MQEQHPYKMTPDKGWSLMSSVLDQNMPVERRSRRFIVFWWTVAAGFTAALIALFVLINGPENASPINIAQENTGINSASMPVEPTHGTDLKNTQVKENSPIVSSIETESISNPSVVQKSSPARNTNKKESKAVNTNTGSTPAQQVATVETNSDAPSIQENTIASEEIIAGEISDSDQTAIQTQIPHNADRDNHLTEFLPSLLVSDLDVPAYHFENTLACCTPAKKRITPHLTISGIQVISGGVGIQGGAGADINLTPKLSVSANMGYSIYNPEATLFGANDRSGFADIDAILRDDLVYAGIGDYLPAESVGSASGSVISRFVRTIHQWQFSTGLKYDISRRFFAEGGVTFGFGTTTRSTHPVVTNVNNDPLSGNSLKVSNSLDDYHVVRSNTTSVYAGIGYRPFKNAEIAAQWTHGLHPYFQNKPAPLNADGSRTDYIRGLQIGLKYYL